MDVKGRIIVMLDGRCLACGGSGMKVLHRQGDPVPDCEQSERSRTVFASTVWTPCDCMIFESFPCPGMRCCATVSLL